MSRATCAVTREPIDGAALLAACTTPADGAALLFLGVVRNHNDGRAVGHLEYEAYEPMAVKVLEKIAEEAEERWALGGLAVVHRVGKMKIGEASVAVAVAAPHRAEAYEASRYIMEELKQRMPIWKREGYLSGEREWLDGNTPGPAAVP